MHPDQQSAHKSGDFRKMLEAALGSAPDPQSWGELKAVLDNYDARQVQPLSGGGGGDTPPPKPRLP
ncbi:hypothetical protein [uncultured Novosphingobium sp.]|uniref:hypothetical protein n=1 Tax=uncultured Novosphingobium sp. TaxID=292277 RepID=UPI00374A702F